VYRRIFSRSEF